LFPVPSWATSIVVPPGPAVACVFRMQIELIARTESKGTPRTGHPKKNPRLDGHRRTQWTPRGKQSQELCSPQICLEVSNKFGRSFRTPHRRDGMQPGATVTGIVIVDSTCLCSVPVVRAYLLYSVLQHF